MIEDFDKVDPRAHFILDAQGNPQPTDSVMAWAEMFANHERRTVAQTHWHGILVSTVFLGLNHQWIPGRPPLIWETMIFGGPLDGYQTRCTTREQAVQMHETALRTLKTSPKVWLWVLRQWVKALYEKQRKSQLRADSPSVTPSRPPSG